MGIPQNVLIIRKLLYPSETVRRYPFLFHELLCSTSVLFFMNIAIKKRSMAKVYRQIQYQADIINLEQMKGQMHVI